MEQFNYRLLSLATRATRAHMDLGQKELAYRLGLYYNTIHRYERGDSMPDPSVLQGLQEVATHPELKKAFFLLQQQAIAQSKKKKPRESLDFNKLLAQVQQEILHER